MKGAARAAVIRSATATAAATSPDVVLVAEWVAVSSVESESGIIATALEVAAALSPGCEYVSFPVGFSVDVGTACLAVRLFAAGFDSTPRIGGTPPAAAALGDFTPAAVVGAMRAGRPGIGMS